MTDWEQCWQRHQSVRTTKSTDTKTTRKVEGDTISSWLDKWLEVVTSCPKACPPWFSLDLFRCVRKDDTAPGVVMFNLLVIHSLTHIPASNACTIPVSDKYYPSVRRMLPQSLICIVMTLFYVVPSYTVDCTHRRHCSSLSWHQYFVTYFYLRAQSFIPISPEPRHGFL